MSSTLNFSTTKDVLTVCDSLLSVHGLSLYDRNEIVLKPVKIDLGDSSVSFSKVSVSSENVESDLEKLMMDKTSFENTEFRVAIVLSYLVEKELEMDNCTLVSKMYYWMIREVFDGDTEFVDRDMMLIDSVIDLKKLSLLFSDEYEFIPEIKG